MTVGMDAGNVSTENTTKESQVAGSLRFDWMKNIDGALSPTHISFLLVPPTAPEDAVE